MDFSFKSFYSVEITNPKGAFTSSLCSMFTI